MYLSALGLAIISIGIVLYIFGLLGNNYYFLVENTSFVNIINQYVEIFYTVRNGVFVGFIYMAIGLSIAYNKKEILFLNYKLIICFILYITEILLLNGNKSIDDSSLFNMLPIVSYFPFIYVLSLKEIFVKIYLKTGKLLRNLSIGVYLLYYLILSIIQIIMFIYNIVINPLIIFLIVYSICVIICIVSYRYNNSFICKLLK